MNKLFIETKKIFNFPINENNVVLFKEKYMKQRYNFSKYIKNDKIDISLINKKELEKIKNDINNN
jgi:hypothetical protein